MKQSSFLLRGAFTFAAYPPPTPVPEERMDVMEWTVNEALRTAPQLMGIFNRLGLDTCCGGTLTLGEAAGTVGLTPDELRAALEPALGTKYR